MAIKPKNYVGWQAPGWLNLVVISIQLYPEGPPESEMLQSVSSLTSGKMRDMISWLLCGM